MYKYYSYEIVGKLHWAVWEILDKTKDVYNVRLVINFEGTSNYTTEFAASTIDAWADISETEVKRLKLELL